LSGGESNHQRVDLDLNRRREKFMPEESGRLGAEDEPSEDVKKGEAIGGIGGAVTGAIVGSMAGALGTVAGAVIGGIVGAAASKAAVEVIDHRDHPPQPDPLDKTATTTTVPPATTLPADVTD
jgi:phage tail tape-measure protein